MYSQLKKFLNDKGLIEAGSSPTITALSGGLWNDVYRVKTTSQDWIVKSMEEDNSKSRFYPNQPQQEKEALELLASLDIAPELVAFFPAEHNNPAILIYEFASGHMLTKELHLEDRKPMLKLVAELLAKQHSTDIDQSEFRQVPAQPNAMMLLAKNLLSNVEDDNNTKRLQHFESTLENNLNTIKAKDVLLHTDAWAGNFIFNKSRNKLTLIDWQCPAIGDPTFDIWTFACSGYNLLEGERLFNDEEKQFFIDCYIELSGDKNFKERFEYFEAYFTYQVAAHSCQRVVALSEENPKASKAFQKIFNLHLSRLENLYG